MKSVRKIALTPSPDGSAASCPFSELFLKSFKNNQLEKAVMDITTKCSISSDKRRGLCIKPRLSRPALAGLVASDTSIAIHGIDCSFLTTISPCQSLPKQ
ncbi:hypothetical protein [Pseudomonas sp. SCB32]|uniref:hypothetical protein n=1 Tax=Pseudomonas sp. SCB32 TaxID=2653853 RepID=UPI001C499D9C|nr:hypothetical protein [Pseudomonas sp. SCB32]